MPLQKNKLSLILHGPSRHIIGSYLVDWADSCRSCVRATLGAVVGHCPSLHIRHCPKFYVCANDEFPPIFGNGDNPKIPGSPEIPTCVWCMSRWVVIGGSTMICTPQPRPYIPIISQAVRAEFFSTGVPSLDSHAVWQRSIMSTGIAVIAI